VWREFSPLHQAPLLRQPALVIHDTHDGEVPFGEGAALAAAWPGATLLATHRLGHTRILREATVVEAVVAFIAASSNPNVEENRHA